MSDTYNYEVLEPGGHARLVGNVLDRISRASANPASAVGSSRAVLGDSETASWMERTTAADGAALIEAVYGNTVVDSGSLLPVRMEGIETVGFNQWDEVWEKGGISSSTGVNNSDGLSLRSKNYIPVSPATEYFAHIGATGMTGVFKTRFYDADKNYLGYVDNSGAQIYPNTSFVTPANAFYMRFQSPTGYGETYHDNICINISDPSRNGTYEPYWRSERTISAATYFPQGLRSAGSVRDELRADAAVTRVGAVDLGTLSWGRIESGDVYIFQAIIDTMAISSSRADNISCAKYTVENVAGFNLSDKCCSRATGSKSVYVRDTDYTDAATFKSAMSGVYMFYALATPTTQPIDPPLPLSYRTGAGGTERVMVASGTTSAPPIFVTRYPLDPADLAASIAPVDGPIAKTNHQVGDLIMLGFTLCKATQVIVTGETIEIGTNVTRTSVAAELAALSE